MGSKNICQKGRQYFLWGHPLRDAVDLRKHNVLKMQRRLVKGGEITAQEDKRAPGISSLEGAVFEELEERHALEDQQRDLLRKTQAFDVKTDPRHLPRRCRGHDVASVDWRTTTDRERPSSALKDYSVGIFVNPLGGRGSACFGASTTFIKHRLHLGHRA